MQGYSGFFDLVRVDVPLLDRVYQHDVDSDPDRSTPWPRPSSSCPPSRTKLAAALPDAARAKSTRSPEQWDVREGMLKGVE